MMSTRELLSTMRSVFQPRLASPPILSARGPVPRFYAKTFANLEKIDPTYDFKNFYILNSNLQRCDEFTKSHDGKHILFAGCSETFGVGNVLEDVWAYKLYQKISSTEKTSGYFNIGLPGGTISEILAQIYKYFMEFGYPDVLFINFPDHHRELSRILDDIHKKKGKDFKTDIDQDYVATTIAQSYTMLVSLCRENGVKVFPFSWELDYLRDGYELIDPRQKISGLLKISEDDLVLHCEKFSSENENDKMNKFFLTALDGDHSGIAVHDFWYNEMYKYYKEDES